jgi:hypothetical protein
MAPPFFDPNGPMLLNLAGYGMVIGHEIFHGAVRVLRRALPSHAAAPQGLITRGVCSTALARLLTGKAKRALPLTPRAAQVDRGVYRPF